MIASAFRVLYALADGEAVRRLQDSFPLQMQALHEAHHMRPRLMDFFLGAQKLILEQRKKSGSVICDQALSIIEERYMDPDLSLVVISSEIAVSPNYLSALIKKSTGSTFIDLLTRRRIETAKELVIGTSMKVKEISERCGYNDQHYFSYCFKKYTGLSPGGMRGGSMKNSNRKVSLSALMTGSVTGIVLLAILIASWIFLSGYMRNRWRRMPLRTASSRWFRS